MKEDQDKTKIFARKIRAKIKIKQEQREVTTRESPINEEGFRVREFLPGAKYANVIVKITFGVYGEPKFTEAEIEEKLFEVLKEIEV